MQRIAYLTLLGLVVAGCDSEEGPIRQGGDKRGDTGGDSGSWPCTYTTTEVALDEVTPLEFAAADVLDFTVGASEQTFEWLSTDVVVDLALGVTLDAEDARYVEGQSTGTDDFDCGRWIAVDLRVSFLTSDGVLAEAFGTTLGAYSATSAMARAEMAGEDLEGTYSFPAGANHRALTWDMTFEAGVKQGSVTESYQQSMGGGIGSATRGIVGAWPAGSYKE